VETATYYRLLGNSPAGSSDPLGLDFIDEVIRRALDKFDSIIMPIVEREILPVVEELLKSGLDDFLDERITASNWAKRHLWSKGICATARFEGFESLEISDFGSST